MKKYLTLVLLGSIMQFAPGSADEQANDEGKIYVRPRAVRIMKDKIVVFTKDGAFLTQAVARDEKGLFVQEEGLEKAPDTMKQKKWGKRFGKKFGKKRGTQCGKRCGGKKWGQWKKGNHPRWNKKANADVSVAEEQPEAVVSVAVEPAVDAE